MEDFFNEKAIESYLYSCDSIITDVNKEFIDFTGFKTDELIGKSLIEIGDMLKFNSQLFLDNISDSSSAYIFTKSLQVREVTISIFYGKETNEKVYIFIEKQNSRLNDKLIFVEQSFIDNISGMGIYSVPDLILLKVNQKYLDFMDSPFNKEEISIGKPIREILPGFVGSQIEVNFNTVLETQKSNYIKEFEFDEFTRGTTYWDASKVPVFENGKLKYIFETAIEVTERVLNKQSLDRQNIIIQQQLEQQNAKLTSIIENLSEGVTIADNKGKILMVNSEAKRLLYQAGKVTSLGDVFKTVKLFDMKGNEIPFENIPGIRALRGEKVKNAKLFLKHPNKEYFVEASSIPVCNSNGDLTIVVSCFHDISETIMQSRKIEEQKKELEAIIENIADGITIFDKEGRYILINKSAREMYFQSDECIDKIDDKYELSEFYDINGEKVNSEYSATCVMKGEKIKNMRISAKFPHKTCQIDVSGTPIYDSEGKFTLGVICSRDMTDYFKYEESIKTRYEFLNRMIDTFDLPVIRLSCPNLKIVDTNKKAFNIIKSLKPYINSINQLKDNKVKDLFEIFMTSDYYQCISEVLNEKETKYMNKHKILVNGKEIYWNIIFEPIFGISGEIEEILVLIIDVTAEIKSNIDMEEALKSQGEFLVNISHELKTPLNVIFSTAQLFSMYCSNGSLNDKKESIIKYIDSIKQNSYRLSKLINNIVDLSKIEAGFFELNLSNNNIVAVVEEIVMSITDFTESKGLNIIFDTDIEEKIIACDAGNIERIVLNLISNAIKFSNTGDEIFVNVKVMEEFVEISVKDNGIGIEEKYLDMIFDRFKQVDKSLTRNAEGTGIGLSLVKSIAELHGGSIYVESKFGKGSKFTVRLPSRKVFQENMLYNNEVRSKNQSIQLDFSDVYS